MVRRIDLLPAPTVAIAGDNDDADSADDDLDVPLDLCCPITQKLYRDPVFAADGKTYDRKAIVAWFRRAKTTSPLTNAQLSSQELRPNDDMRARVALHRDARARRKSVCA